MSSYITIDGLTFEDLLNNTIYNRDDISNINEKKYDKIPEYFVSMEGWPKYTNLKCSYCTLKINGILLFEPRSIDTDGRIETGPSICNFKCMLKNIERYPVQEYNNKLSLIKILHKRVTGYELENHSTNINKYELTKFGGMTSAKEFLRKIYDEYNNKLIYMKLFASNSEATNFINYIEEI